MNPKKDSLQKINFILKAVWLLFPSFVFLLICWQCFWVLSQGKDIIISTFEKERVSGLFLIALVFFVFVTWYTGRILIYRKKIFSDTLKQFDDQKNSEFSGSQDDLPYYLQVIFNLPRFFGFMIFGIVWISFLNIQPLSEDQFLGFGLSTTACYFLLLATIGIYIGLYAIAKKLRKKHFETDQALLTEAETAAEDKALLRKKNKLFLYYFLLLFILVFLNMFIHSAALLLVSVILLQILFPFIVVIRRDKKSLQQLPLLNFKTYHSWLHAEKLQPGFVKWVMYQSNVPKSEAGFFRWFNYISFIGIVFYLVTIFNLSFSVWLGSFPFLFLAFGVLVGFLAVVSVISVAREINLHLFLFLLAIIVGRIPSLEPHYVDLAKRNETDTVALSTRPYLHTYFQNWVDARKAAIDSSATYPVYFELSDGGASRSGYWTASALGKLEDETNGKFSKHLFCLSGASGGSVGNGTFYALLNENRIGSKVNSYREDAKDFLREDFLTYTLARLLGPDYLRFILPLPFIDDRADALEHAMENDGSDTVLLHKKFDQHLSAMLPFGSNNKDLPVLCINTTRMQDGRPGLVSTIKLTPHIFGERIDVLASIDKDHDMRLSSAVVLGARFPYLSPAGRIGESYYVDGGYFDNSGAGAVHEMIIELHRIINDTTFPGWEPSWKKLKFNVIHITNSPVGGADTGKVHPLKNDLAAPLLTLVGAYGTQTAVNNLRLIKYLEDINRGKSSYKMISLYEDVPATLSFPMNWTISNYWRNKMDEQLATNDTLKSLINTVNALKY
ncbi:MAG: patatin-like phospholipase family protein [Panacibacter sp.]